MRAPFTTCRETADLLTRAKELKLSLARRMALRMHLFFCPPCRNYRQQLGMIDAASHNLDRQGATDGPRLSEAARQRIREKLAR